MSLNHELVLKASKALLTHAKQRSEKEDSSNLLADEKETVILQLGLKRFNNRSRHKPYRIPLRTAIYDSDSQVCLFTKDDSKEYAAKIMALGVPQIKEVISIKKLKHDHKAYEAKRRVLTSYDLFLTDDRILNSLPKALGTKFFQRKKLPFPVNLDASDLKKELSKAIGSTFYSPTTGTTSVVRVGSTEMTADQLAENIECAVEAIAARVPKGWKNVQSLHIKTGKSLALPIYNSLPEEAEAIARIAGASAAKKAEAEDEESDEEVDASEESEEEEEEEEQMPAKKLRKSPLSRESKKPAAATKKSPAKKGPAKKRAVKA
ncbi:proteasome-interacting protein cic1 [Linderina pennispora]|nr:proteasome-interacting protein cic1 [Linderina pennispora]